MGPDNGMFVTISDLETFLILTMEVTDKNTALLNLRTLWMAVVLLPKGLARKLVESLGPLGGQLYYLQSH